MTPARRRSRRSSKSKKTTGPQARRTTKGAKKSKTAGEGSPTPPRAAPPEGPTLKSQAQLEIRLARGARPLTATEQAARLASAQMERRIGRLLARRVTLKFVRSFRKARES